MWQLNLPEYQFRLKQTEKGYFILDNFRKRFVKLTPEEWVRQNFLRYLTEIKQFPSALIAVEKQLTMNGMKKRCDAILYDIQANPVMIIEFKAPNITINQQVFDQAAEIGFDQPAFDPLGDRGAATAAPFDQAFGFEFVEGALRGNPRYAEGAREVEFGRQQGFVAVGAGQNLLAQQYVDLMVERRPQGRVERQLFALGWTGA